MQFNKQYTISIKKTSNDVSVKKFVLHFTGSRLITFPEVNIIRIIFRNSNNGVLFACLYSDTRLKALIKSK